MAVDYRHPLIEVATAQGAGGERQFWKELERTGTPLVEPVPGEAATWVTFVGRLPPGAEYLVISGMEPLPADARMHRIEGTDICYRTWRMKNDRRVSYTFVPDLPLIDPSDCTPEEDALFKDHLRANPQKPDPLCREKIEYPVGTGERDFASVVSLPDAPAQPYCDKRPDIPRGRLQTHEVASALLGNERRVIVYTPPGYEDGARDYPYMLVFDGGVYLSRVPTHRILDNLLADGIVGPMLAFFIDPATDRPQARTEELALADDYIEFLATELHAWMKDHYRIAADPAANIVAGSSLGGLSSAWLGFTHPELYGKVLSQSGSYWAGRDFAKSRLPPGRARGEWLVDQFEQSEARPIDIYMDVGEYESEELMVKSNRRLKGVLEARGYSLTYQEFAGGHDYACWRGTLVDGIRALVGRR